ncbi:MAG: alpha-amylase [Anaerolineae bacterium]|nr:alpha-amylase [Anaerolineae bacterium]
MAIHWPTNPLIYEINTWTWLHALSDQYNRRITLGSVPDAELDALANWNLDVIWLMGVWERSPAGQQIAREHPGLQAEYRRALPDFSPEDVVGSPYAVRRYSVDSRLGGREELAALRARLADRGLRLVLDYVPNHVAPDHPWLVEHPDCFVQGVESDQTIQPAHFFRGLDGRRVVANGRDPYFPAWTDTAQLNAFSPALRSKTVDTLLDIAAQCDAVRCDMAMLVTNRVFTQTWGERVGPAPQDDFWPTVIPAVKTHYPEFQFIAEVYWDMEWELQQQGFDYTYDKRLYDRLKNETAPSIVAHFGADMDYQARMVRFIENHDEPRAAATLGYGRDFAAAVLVTTLPGATLFHEGQFYGHRVKLPVQLGRRPHEHDNADFAAFYRVLLQEASQPIYHQGEWRLCDIWNAWAGNNTHRNLIAYTWQHGDDRCLVIVNFSPLASQGRVVLHEFGLQGRVWTLRDVLHAVDYERDGNEIHQTGLYIDLKPWWTHVLELR